MISHDAFMGMTDEHWTMEQQLVFLAENQDWCDLFFQVIKEKWEEIGDTMEISCIQAFADNNGLKLTLFEDPE
tara:strand:+ start:597 stop:815 length:219 start_codon:yes stop_codon:yes gene_type:complete